MEQTVFECQLKRVLILSKLCRMTYFEDSSFQGVNAIVQRARQPAVASRIFVVSKACFLPLMQFAYLHMWHYI